MYIFPITLSPHHPIKLSPLPLLYLWLRKEKGIGEVVKNYSKHGQYTEYCTYCQNRSGGKILKEIRFLIVFTLHELVSKTSQ